MPIKRLSLSAIAVVACLTPLAEEMARGQTMRQEGRLEARAARQAGRANARAFGDFGYYLPGYYYGPGYGPGYYAGPGYYGSYYRGPGYVVGPGYGPAPAAGRAYLGITMRETPDGVVRVSGVRANSPADEAGVRPGDTLIAMDGREIYSAQDVTRMVARHVPGEAVRFDIDRNGQSDEIEAVLAAPGQLVGPPPRATYPAEYPVDRSQYPAYEPYEVLPPPTQVRRVPNTFINVY